MTRHPFASLAFLSGLPEPTFGAGQGLAGLAAALWPIEPTRGSAALWPHPPNGHAALWPHPPNGHAALWPIPLEGLSALWPIEPTRLPSTSAADESRSVLVETSSLLNRALRSSRAKIVRGSDSRDAPLRQRKTPEEMLWRWAPDSRIKTISCELIQRFHVADRSLWLVNPPPVGAPMRLQTYRVFRLPKPLSEAEQDEQTDKVIRAAVEREDRLSEILTQASDFGPFFESITGVYLERAPRLAELMAVVQDTAVHLVMLLKHVMASKRPVEASSRVMPMIATPGHGSLPSGHATLAALTSELLHLLMYQAPDQKQRSYHLDRLARRIAFNRVVAGVHYPVDSQAGYALGTLLARLFFCLAGHPGKPPRPPAANDVAGGHFDLPELPDGGSKGRPTFSGDSRYTVEPAPTLRELWAKTEVELAEVRI